MFATLALNVPSHQDNVVDVNYVDGNNALRLECRSMRSKWDVSLKLKRKKSEFIYINITIDKEKLQ